MPEVAAAPEEVVEEKDHIEMVPMQEAPVAHEVIMADVKPELLRPRLYHMLMRDCGESPLGMMDDLDDWKDSTKASSDMDEWFLEDGSNDQD
jgi:hypothetical protein